MQYKTLAEARTAMYQKCFLEGNVLGSYWKALPADAKKQVQSKLTSLESKGMKYAVGIGKAKDEKGATEAALKEAKKLLGTDAGDETNTMKAYSDQSGDFYLVAEVVYKPKKAKTESVLRARLEGIEETDTDDLGWDLIQPTIELEEAEKIIHELLKRQEIKLLDSLSRHPDVRRDIKIEIIKLIDPTRFQ
jgi:hypothetical protein